MSPDEQRILDSIKARYDYDEAGYRAFEAFHKARKHSTADSNQAHEHRLHCDVGFLLKKLGG